MRRAERLPAALAVALAAALTVTTPVVHAQAACDKPVYLTFDTGHMGIAPLVADVLKRQNVKVTAGFMWAPERRPHGE